MKIRDANLSDVEHLAFLINLAGEGLPMFLWSDMARQGQDPLAIGAIRAAREEGSFSYRNAKIVEIEGSVAGMVLSYALPDPYDTGLIGDCPDVVRPLLRLEANVPGSWYVNAIATYEPFRGRGVASTLMSTCENIAMAACATLISLIVASENSAAHALYLKLGYEELASEPLIAFPGGPGGGEWILMAKHLD